MAALSRCCDRRSALDAAPHRRAVGGQGCGFQKDGSLVFLPPDGEFTLLNYRISSHFRPPLVIIPTINEIGADSSLRGIPPPPPHSPNT
jgi:hypothetical protein